MAFEYRYTQNGQRVVIEERQNAVEDRSALVVAVVEGVFSDAEMQSILADATAAWLHPLEPPVEWFE